MSGLLNFERPIALLTVSVLNSVPDHAEIMDLLARYRSALARGSYLAISYVPLNHHPDGGAAAQEWYRHTNPPSYARSYTEVSALLSGFNLVEPGLINVTDWRPTDGEQQVTQAACWADVAHMS